MKNLNKTKKTLFMIILSVYVLAASSCNFFSTVTGDNGSADIEITSLKLQKSALTMKVGTMEYVSVSIKPESEQKKVKLTWTYDNTIIDCDSSSPWGVTITGLKEGQTSLKCSYSGYESTCIITVAGFAEGYEETKEPYIYSNTTILQTKPGLSERVYVSLSGGTAADIDGYTWTNENPSVCALQPTGQYCLITALDSGYSRIKITHTKALYPYYIGVYVFEDGTHPTYITTQNNIITLNQDSKEEKITVSLVDGKETSKDSDFIWELVNEVNSEIPVKIETNGGNAVVTPLKAGSCTIRVTHPDAAYPLDILCRVITIVKNVYIKPSDSVVTLSGDKEKTITSTLENIKTGEYNIDAFEYALDDYDVAEIFSFVGNEVLVKGKANGACKLIITHEKAAYSREVLLIVEGQTTNAVDASCYITTNQNYIKTKIGGDDVKISISLKGGEDGDENNFIWAVNSSPEDESDSDVIELSTANGKAIHSRAAAQTYAFGEATISPKNVGTAVITVTHPKVFYPTEILIRVLDENASLEDGASLYFVGEGLVKLLNGEETDYTVQLRGNKKTGDESNIKWDCNNNSLKITANENTANIKAPSAGTGETVSSISIAHPKATSKKNVVVLTADDQSTLDSMKALYSDKQYYNINVGETVYLMTSQAGFGYERNPNAGNENEPPFLYEEYDFSSATWTIDNPDLLSLKKTSDPLTAEIKALRTGKAKVKIQVESYTYEYTVTIYPEGTEIGESEVYFTTSQNVVTIPGAGKSAKASVIPINLAQKDFSAIEWEEKNADIIDIIPNGNEATITAKTEGETVIIVSHPKSQNTIKVYVRVGSEYVMDESEPVTYISCIDVITMIKDDSPQKIEATLVNNKTNDNKGFHFRIDNENIASIANQTETGLAYIKPMEAGQAEITVTNDNVSYSKKVLVIVANTAEELAGIKYLTTSANVVSIGEGQTRTVSVSVKNSDEIILDGYNWVSSNPSVIDITSTSGATAVLRGNSIGTAIIRVTNDQCKYELQIIAQCVNPLAAAENPFIQLSKSVVTAPTNAGYISITADLVGGTDSDKSNFVWLSNDPSICTVYGQNEIGMIKALKTGQTYITVSHPKANYSAQLLVVCDEIKQSECYITVPQNIINMKPTDSIQTITATLVNGTQTDKYNFNFSLDVYDIIDFTYSANVCTIKPKQQGQVTLTISHPKSAYDLQVIITVQEYTDFEFPETNVTMTQGTVKFFQMKIPNTNVTTHVEYSTSNEKICTIGGTKKTAQITAVGNGTTTVKAKLIASSTGVVQAESEMLVYIKEAPVNAVYLTSTNTIYSLDKGKSQTLSATVLGNDITIDDQYKIKWTTSDTDIISITGLNTSGVVEGQSIFVNALNPGEALITCSHDKAQSDLQFFIVVPGLAEKTISLNKTFLNITKGSTQTVTLKATIANSESSNDYNQIEWEVIGKTPSGEEVCTVMGSGKEVYIYPINVGEAEIHASLPDNPNYAKCTVKVEAQRSLTFETATISVEPFHTATVKYTVSPPDSHIQWTQTKDSFSFEDLGADANGNGSVVVEGIKTGDGQLVGVTDNGAKGNISIRTEWDYSLNITGKTTFKITPEQTAVMEYYVKPAEADIVLESTDEDCFFYQINSTDTGKGIIEIVPQKETLNPIQIIIRATNPLAGGELVGSKTLQASFKYAELEPKIELVTDGQFSYFNNEQGIFYIGDGEHVTIDIQTPKTTVANNMVIDVTHKKGAQTAEDLSEPVISGSKTKRAVVQFTAGEDVQEEVYNVTKAYRPLTAEGIDIPNWKNDFITEINLGDNYYVPSDIYNRKEWEYMRLKQISSGKPVYEHAYTCTFSWARNKGYLSPTPPNHDTTVYPNNVPDYMKTENFKKIEDPSLLREYSISEFENIGYWYTPTKTASWHVTVYWWELLSWENYMRWGYINSRWEEGVFTEHVTAEKRISENTAVIKQINCGYISINGTQYPVIKEVRKCSKGLIKE